MDQAVIEYYRRLLRSGFGYAGKIENPSIFLDPAVEGNNRICSGPVDYMNIYIKIRENVIEEIKYLCICDPTANVAVEALCKLMKGKRLKEAASMHEEKLLEEIGSNADELREKTSAIIELLRKGLSRLN
jgi:NifU-like protein involved in Fe-S cluster formation